MITLESSISKFKKPLYVVVRTSSLRATHSVIIIETLPKCLLSATLIISLESHITKLDSLILLILKSSNFSLNLL